MRRVGVCYSVELGAFIGQSLIHKSNDKNLSVIKINQRNAYIVP